ncbi:MAG: signal recognition particle-docking protein FtsY [Flavobacteriales bacterium TMED191]|nr:MAG: signal recognition particle-docking protein FtsY [Flavobacteriales bacterium TMED191]
MSKSNISNNSLIDNSDSQKSKLDKSLDKTRDGFFGKMKLFFTGKNKVDDTFLDQLEEMLITSDVGVKTTIKIIDLVETFVAKNKYVNQEELKIILKNQIIGLLNVNQKSDNTENTKPYVILFVGVNGVGKTTTIAKLANFFKTQGKSVLIGAADTFRAAAIDQIDKWANQINVPIVKQKMGSDPAAVAYDTIQSAIASNIDYVIIDTAGRLHNKINLMSELEKISSAIGKLTHSAPHEVVLALDASTGQNALEQAKQFLKATNVTHLAITKLDGTAKGGVVISICDQLSIPIKYIGVGEKIEDIQLFNKMEFVESLFK